MNSFLLGVAFSNALVAGVLFGQWTMKRTLDNWVLIVANLICMVSMLSHIVPLL